ncbi:hypothetical protein [Hyphomicrobium sp. CS1GBMeth3]|uniref:hypothetical protein n=1 Tax=Hyphomicrobium sp. CS1GBMeth3 TaxID=1892845 RepID=UPI000931179D|nr:hypothetical protein [Hyphomicrobium sp. CS1GBMeth3]
MRRFIATGRVHPERADVSFTTIRLGLAPLGKAQVHCDSSQITVVIEGDFDGFLSAHITAHELASMVTDALGMFLGTGYSVEMIQIIEDNGDPHVFGVRPLDADDKTLGFAQEEQLFEQVLKMSAADVFFRFATSDYVRAITNTQDCATYCYRSIESIKSALALKTGVDSWKPLHEAVGTTRETIEQSVKRFADPVRHGNWIELPTTTAAQRYEMLKLTRDILLSYLKHVGAEGRSKA